MRKSAAAATSAAATSIPSSRSSGVRCTAASSMSSSDEHRHLVDELGRQGLPRRTRGRLILRRSSASWRHLSAFRLRRSRSSRRRAARRSSGWDDPARRAEFHSAPVILLLAILLVIFASVASPWGLIVILVACVLEVGEIAFLRRWARRLDRRTREDDRRGSDDRHAGRSCPVMPPDRDGSHQRRSYGNARCDAGADAGQTVHVQSVDGLMLVVA